MCYSLLSLSFDIAKHVELGEIISTLEMRWTRVCLCALPPPPSFYGERKTNKFWQCMGEIRHSFFPFPCFLDEQRNEAFHKWLGHCSAMFYIHSMCSKYAWNCLSAYYSWLCVCELHWNSIWNLNSALPASSSSTISSISPHLLHAPRYLCTFVVCHYLCDWMPNISILLLLYQKQLLLFADCFEQRNHSTNYIPQRCTKNGIESHIAISEKLRWNLIGCDLIVLNPYARCTAIHCDCISRFKVHDVMMWGSVLMAEISSTRLNNFAILLFVHCILKKVRKQVQPNRKSIENSYFTWFLLLSGLFRPLFVFSFIHLCACKTYIVSAKFDFNLNVEELNRRTIENSFFSSIPSINYVYIDGENVGWSIAIYFVPITLTIF